MVPPMSTSISTRWSSRARRHGTVHRSRSRSLMAVQASIRPPSWPRRSRSHATARCSFPGRTTSSGSLRPATAWPSRRPVFSSRGSTRSWPPQRSPIGQAIHFGPTTPRPVRRSLRFVCSTFPTRPPGPRRCRLWRPSRPSSRGGTTTRRFTSGGMRRSRFCQTCRSSRTRCNRVSTTSSRKPPFCSQRR